MRPSLVVIPVKTGIPFVPKWEVRGPDARNLTIKLNGNALSLDLAALYEQQFDLTHIGGIRAYYEIKDEVRRWV